MEQENETTTLRLGERGREGQWPVSLGSVCALVTSMIRWMLRAGKRMAEWHVV